MPNASSICPRCRRSTASPFPFAGVCLRCAGERVLAADDGAGGDPPLPLDDGGPGRPGSIPPPNRIGPYEIVEELGRGGMGTVFAARQAGLGRIVALKVLATTGNLAGLDLRFLREAQTVARLQHPHIVSVYDSGRAPGYVYFSMEYVPGGDLGRRLRERPFQPREAAALLEKIASAVALAHAEGVVHRDIKPSNILLDGDVPKLADFGLAAQLEPGGDLTMGSGVLGTPHYIAPEGLRGGSAALTIASDIYALGAVLYQCLTGRTPFAGVSPVELAALIERVDPPVPHLIAPTVPRDLETICLTCLERSPWRRYRSAGALASDLRRFRSGRTILARPPSTLDRWTKFATRHRAAVIAGTAALGVLVTATVVSTALAVRARRAEKQAMVEAGISRAESDFLQNDLLGQASPEQQPDRELRLRTVLDRAAKRIDGRFGEQPLVEAALRMTLAATYEGLGEYELELPHLERAFALRRRSLGERDPRTLRVRTALAQALQHCARYKEAEALGRETWEWQQSILGPEHPDTLASAAALGLIYQSEGKYPEAARLLESTLAARQRVLGATHADTLETMTQLAVVLRIQGQLARAESYQRSVLAARLQTLGPEHPATLRSRGELAAIYYVAGKYAEAEAAFQANLEPCRRVLGPEAPDTLTNMNNLALTLQAGGKLAEAKAMFTEVLAVSRRVRGPEHPNTLNSMVNLALTDYALEHAAEAQRRFEETVTLLRKVLGTEHATTLGAQVNLALADGLGGNYAAADELIAATVAASTKVLGPDHPTTLAALNAQGVLATGEGRYDAAVALLRRTVAVRQRVLGEEHPATVASLYNLAVALERAEQLAEAETLQRKALDIRERKFGPANLSTLQSVEGFASVLLAAKKFTAAEPWWRRAWQGRVGMASNQWRRFDDECALGLTLLGLDRPAEAEPLLVEAAAGLGDVAVSVPPAYRDHIARAAAARDACRQRLGRAADARVVTAGVVR